MSYFVNTDGSDIKLQHPDPMLSSCSHIVNEEASEHLDKACRQRKGNYRLLEGEEDDFHNA